MSPKEQYAQKLRDPRWQKRRLEIFQRDGFRCRACKTDEVELHVHHLKYTGSNPWDAGNGDLETLCADCHRAREDANREMAEFIRTAGTKSLLLLAQEFKCLHEGFVKMSKKEIEGRSGTTNKHDFTVWLCARAISEARQARLAKSKRKRARR